MTGVRYRAQDYAGVWRRLLTDIVDIGVVLVLVAGSWFLIDAVMAEAAPPWMFVWLGTFLPPFVYLVLLKRSPTRTVGYRLFGLRIVDLQGRVPGVPALTLRLAFAVFGPLNLLLDLAWIPSDRDRQALRDKFAHTYVVRADAQPASSGRIEFRRYFFLSWSFLFQEVAADPRVRGESEPTHDLPNP